mmetsp:Transcript_20108/g.25466  ORF Transcript_20108/g.25466 Transcript_20108/m.25466 type:complete len:1248 (-) Transcript_20108:83-3826(-)
MYDNKHPGDWSRGRRTDFGRERDDRYSRRDPYYNPPYSPKRRKLESGEAETVEFDPPRRAPYSPYDAPVSRVPAPRSYYRDTYEPGIRRPHEENHYYQHEYTRPAREYSQPGRRYPDSALDTERKGDMYQRRLFDEVDVGRKRPRTEISSNRFLNSRQYDRITPLSPNTPINKIASTALSLGPRNIYEPQIPPRTDELHCSDSSLQDKSLRSSADQPETPSLAESDEKLPKKEIIDRMDQLDNQISQVEGEIEHFKRLKTICQRKTDKSKLSNVDKILLSNQEIATANIEYMKLFHRTDTSTKPKSDFVHVPENQTTHTLKRPIMMQYMRQCMLDSKEKTKKTAREYEVKRKKWLVKLVDDHIQTPKSVAAINNALPPSPEPPRVVEVTPRGRRSRNSSDAVRSEAEFTQIMKQLSETDKDDPNNRYMKTLAVIPPMLVDKRDLSRVFVDNNRYVEDCGEEYRNHLLTNPWNTEEQTIFLRKYISYPKDFGKIATFLPNKSIEDVICYYFKNKHRLNLKGIIEEIQAKKKPPQRIRTTKPKPSPSRFVNKEVADLHLSNNDSSYWNTPRERRPKSGRSNRERVMPQRNKTTSRASKTRAKSPPRKTSTSKKNLTVQSAGIDQLCFTANVPAPWNESEINQLKIALASYGSDFKAIADFVGSKNHWQCRSFYYNFREQLNLAEFFATGVKTSANRVAIAPGRSLHLSSSDSNAKTSPISALLNAAETPTPETSKDWVLEELNVPSAPKAQPLGLSANNSLLSGNTQKGSLTGHSVPSNGVSVNIRHSFDSFSPLESSEKSSVTWNVDAIASNPLRHSSAEVSVGNYDRSTGVDQPSTQKNKNIPEFRSGKSAFSVPSHLSTKEPSVTNITAQAIPVTIEPQQTTPTNPAVTDVPKETSTEAPSLPQIATPSTATAQTSSEIASSLPENPTMDSSALVSTAEPSTSPEAVSVSEALAHNIKIVPERDTSVLSENGEESLTAESSQTEKETGERSEMKYAVGSSQEMEETTAMEVTGENTTETEEATPALVPVVHTNISNPGEEQKLPESEPEMLSECTQGTNDSVESSDSVLLEGSQSVDENQMTNEENKVQVKSDGEKDETMEDIDDMVETSGMEQDKATAAVPVQNDLETKSEEIQAHNGESETKVSTLTETEEMKEESGSSVAPNEPIPMDIDQTEVLSMEDTAATGEQPTKAEVAEALRFEEEIKIQLANTSCLVFDVSQSTLPSDLKDNLLNVPPPSEKPDDST